MKKRIKLFIAMFICGGMLAGCMNTKVPSADESSQNEDADNKETADVAAGDSSIKGSSDEAGSNNDEEATSSNVSDNSNEDDTENVTAADDIDAISEDGYYYDVESVVLYLDTYDTLPSNYITKSEAKALGWEGGSVEDYKEGAAIGGDYFGNREGILPDNSYTECDIDTNGSSSRGAKRLVFSDDGQYYYTEDHYDSFIEIIVTDGEIEYGETFGD